MSDAAPSMVHKLDDAQRRAVVPGDSIWLKASAGTGKTQVLTTRVLRLLLEGDVRPEQILCLTFTKAGATEMAERINDVLARWVRQDDVALFAELTAIGAPAGPRVRERARTLFASVLDCPGGGLRIDTIHAFSQWLLAAFPEEAGLSGGTRPIEERERLLLARQVLAELLIDAERRGDRALLDALANLSLRMGEDKAQEWLMRCAGGRWLAGDWQQGSLVVPVRRLLGLSKDASLARLATACSDDQFDVASLQICRAAFRQWKSKTSDKALESIEDWLAGDHETRLHKLRHLTALFRTAKGDLRVALVNAFERIDTKAVDAAKCLCDQIDSISDQRTLLDLAIWLAPALELGRAYSRAWNEAKQREGLIDFDDQIERAAALLTQTGMGPWIRYKLDRRFDHVLVDEAQDTNEAQWQIIEALTDDFFAGEGQRGDRARTIFVVGDYKQAIFGFQGTSPDNFESAHTRFKARMVPGPEAPARDLKAFDLVRSFRTAKTVLDFVDRAIFHIGHHSFGLDAPPETHVGQDRPGLVRLWRPVGVANNPDGEAAGILEQALPLDNDISSDDISDDISGDDDAGSENWLSRPERELADRIARQVRHWLDEGFPLVKGLGAGEAPRLAGPGDIMILLRRRGGLARLIVARLHAAGVPVAGVDRLRLAAPLAVRDLVAALRFAAQPFDSLNLASLLVSPLIGWSQEQLLAHGWRAPEERQIGLSLWEHLRRSSHEEVRALLSKLTDLLARADFEPVQALLHWLLVGPWCARARLVARLGYEAHDPIDELLHAAYGFSSTSIASLAGFLAWFDANNGDLKREAAGAGGLVRVMTVHGAKGLQSPIVILADATQAPPNKLTGRQSLVDPGVLANIDAGGDARAVPIPDLSKEERVGRVAEAAELALTNEIEEHWRLLYVAMTRAEEALFITGALTKREKQPAPESWYARLAELGDAKGAEDPIWGQHFNHGALAPLASEVSLRAASTAKASASDEPGWLRQSAPDEPRPSRPLAPSALGEDTSPAPPLVTSAVMAEAARRGSLIHASLERLGSSEAPASMAPHAREAALHRWLARQAEDLDEAALQDIVSTTLAVIDHPRWQDMFAPEALGEARIAAVVGDRVVSGSIDRLLIETDRIRILDFKTARRPPSGIGSVPAGVLRQMAAYVAALMVTWPGRRIEAAVLYTQTPILIEIPEDVLAPFIAVLHSQTSCEAV